MYKKIRLDEIATFDYGANQSATQYDGFNKYIRITDIDLDSGHYDKTNCVSPSSKLDDKYLVKKGDILLARTGASVGKSFILKDDLEKLYFAGFLIRMRVNNNNPEFVYQFTKTSYYWNYIRILSERSGQPGINSKEYGSIEIPIYPIDTQNKIASLLTSIDNVIDNYKEIRNNLEDSKKYYMNIIFSDTESTTKVRLDDVIYKKKSQYSEVDKLEDGKYKLYGATGLVGYTNNVNQVKDYISIIKDGASAGKITLRKSNEETINTLDKLFSHKHNIEYIYYMLHNLNFTKYKVGSTIPHIYFKEYSKEYVNINTDINAQYQISRLLKKIDVDIQSYNYLIDQMKMKKKYYMKKIFM